MKVLAVYILIQIVLCHEIGERFEFQNDPEPDGECGVLMFHTFYGSCKGATCFVTVDEGRQNHEVCSMAGAPLNTDCNYFEKGLVEGKCLLTNCVAEDRTATNHEHCLGQQNMVVHPAGAALSCFINVTFLSPLLCEREMVNAEAIIWEWESTTTE